MVQIFFFFFSSRRRHTRLQGDWSSDVCSSDLRRRERFRSGPRGTALCHRGDDRTAFAGHASALMSLVALCSSLLRKVIFCRFEVPGATDEERVHARIEKIFPAALKSPFANGPELL